MNTTIFLQNKKSNGYTILFTILVISVLATLSVGIANISIKQRFLSRLASDSQSAMYLTDAGMECALYNYYLGTLNGTFSCLMLKDPGSGSATTINMKEATAGSGIFTFDTSLTPVADTEPCFQIETTQDANGNITKIISRGYNTCKTTDSRRVERALEVTFQ